VCPNNSFADQNPFPQAPPVRLDRSYPGLQDSETATVPSPPVPARKRGKCMTRRNGQNPKVRVGKRADGTKYYFFQYWMDIPGQEERKRQTEVIGLRSQMTKSEAERKKLEFISKLELNSDDYHVPSSRTFADAVSHYREVFAPRMLRASTFSVADVHLKAHLEADWNDVPMEHINIEAVNEWMWKKRQTGLSWVTIKNILRTMQRVLSASSKDKKPPFSQNGLAIPERDKLQMKIRSRQKISHSWAHAQQIAEQIRKLENLGQARRERYAVLILLYAASGVRCSELLALRVNDIDFSASALRIDESSDQRSKGKIGPCKNAAAYRTVVLLDAEGQQAMRELRRFVGNAASPNALVFHSKRGGPLMETTILSQALHPALKALGLKKAGLHALRRGCNRRWELAGINPAVHRQQMGHTSAAMTALYTGEVPLEDVKAEFSSKFGNEIVVLENMENEAVA
jgi:integrase